LRLDSTRLLNITLDRRDTLAEQRLE
jgi:hypothetical protein